MTHDHITTDDGYAGIVKSMHEDLQRTEREREIEAAAGDDIERLLRRLDRQCDGNRSEMCRRLNDTLRGAHDGPDEEFRKLGRQTLYNYLDKYDLR